MFPGFLIRFIQVWWACMRITANITTIFKLIAATIGAILPICPIAVCLVLRGAEGWKLWHEMSSFSALGLLAWLWTFAYLTACLVTIFGLDEERKLGWWEFLIDAGNIVTSCILAMRCAKQQFDAEYQLSYPIRFALWLSICLIAQFTVTFAARRARNVSQRLYRQLNPKPAKVVQRRTVKNALTSSQNFGTAAEKNCGTAADGERNQVADVLVG
jgi:hypothetical protein